MSYVAKNLKGFIYFLYMFFMLILSVVPVIGIISVDWTKHKFTNIFCVTSHVLYVLFIVLWVIHKLSI